MKKNVILQAVRGGAISACLYAPVLLASPIDLTDVGYVQYGDGLSYSMPIAQFIQHGDDNLQSGDEFYIQASEGQIKDLVVIGTDASGQSSTNVAGMDHAYDLPSSSGGSDAAFFETGDAVDPGQTSIFHGDLDDTWDVTLAALNNTLAGDDMVIFFQNNQEGQPGTASQSLAGWAQLWITDPDGQVLTDADGNALYFDFTNDDSRYALVSEGGGGNLLGDPGSYTNHLRSDPTGSVDGDGNTIATDYVLSGGEVCLSLISGIPVACDPTDLTVTAPFVHNISDAYASYALVFPELNALMNSVFDDATNDLSLYTMHVDYRLGCDPNLFGTDADATVCSGLDGNDAIDWGKKLNGGGEKLWITAMYTPDTNIPEPSTLVLMGLGLVGMGYRRQRSKRAA